MTFKKREYSRMIRLKSRLFSQRARRSGEFNGTRWGIRLHEDYRSENLEPGIRDEALEYFKDRAIVWHDGEDDKPSNHLCRSQSSCVNFWFPFIRAPDQLSTVLCGLGYDVDEVLAIYADPALRDGSSPFVAFEWIGEKNYLEERWLGKVASDDDRTRGANFTSLDFLLRFRRSDGLIQIVAGEWKYTESYNKATDKRFSSAGTDRLDDIYRKHVEHPCCQIRGDVNLESLFLDPFDQLMRQQLLCTAMERCGEMEADVVSMLHVAPRANRELMKQVTSEELSAVGSDIHQIWEALTQPSRFKGVATEDLIQLVCANAPSTKTQEYLALRYGGMAIWPRLN